MQVATTREAAEQTLGTLTAHPDSIPLMFAVLQSTTSSLARFHAAKALHTVTRDRWLTLSPHHRYSPSSFRHSLISIVIANPQLQPFERVAILRTVAFLTRRAYLEESPASTHSFFNQLCHSASSTHSPPHTCLVSIQLIDLIIDEFTAGSGSSPSSPAIDREMFMRARYAFSSPQGHLIPLFNAALALLDLLTSSTPSQSYSSPPFSSKALPALSIIHRVLTTDFRNAPLASSIDSSTTYDPTSTSISSDALETVVINTFTKPEWHPLINQISVVLSLSFSILAALIAAPNANSDTDTDFLSNPLHIITAVAAISHSSYSSPQAALDTLSTILNGMNEQGWSGSVLGPVRLAYAEVWRRVSCAHGLTNVERLPSNFIDTFTKDTCYQMNAVLLRPVSTEDPIDDDFSMDVIDLLLETWANLALQGDDGASANCHPLSSSIEQIILFFMRMQLRTTGDNPRSGAAQALPDLEEDLGFDDSSIDDSRLSVAAILTRFVLDKAVDALAQSLLQAAEKVFMWPRGHTSVNGLPLDMYQEDLFFLIRLISAVLTDEAKGEYPSVPTQFLPFHDNVVNGHAKSVRHAHTLLTSLFKVAEMESRMLGERGAHCDEASPRVASALLEAFGRIVRTYLAPLNIDNAALTFDVAGGQEVVKQGRTCSFMKAMEGLTQRGFEDDVSEAAGDVLWSLAAASKTYNELMEYGTWTQIVQVGVEALQTLAPRALEDVGKSLTMVLGDVVAEQLLIPVYGCLQTFCQSQNVVANAAERTIAMLNLIRGASKSDILGDRTRQTLRVFLETPGGVAASCMKSFGQTRPDVSRVLMGLADDIVFSTLGSCNENDATKLLKDVLSLIKMHSEIIQLHAEDLTLEELGCDVEEILSILTHILDEQMMDVGEACFYGLSTLLTVMNENVLDIPSVNRCFFSFVAQLVCAHAEKLILLPSDFCSKIIQSIDMQRASFDASSERKALEAIMSLARTRVMMLKRGEQGQSFASSSADSIAIIDSGLQKYLVGIFEAIANGSAHTSSLDAAADALLPLSHISEGSFSPDGASPIAAFEKVGQALVESSGNNSELGAAVLQLARAASEAGAACGLSGSSPNGNSNDSSNANQSQQITRTAVLQATKRFREAVASFSSEARNCLVSVALAASTNQGGA